METLDIIFLCCLIPAVISGLRKGAVGQVISFLTIYLGITLSIRFSGEVSAWLLQHFTLPQAGVRIISFVAVFIIVAILLRLAGKGLEKIVSISMLGWLNRIVGVLAAVAVGIMILSIAVYAIDAVNKAWSLIPKGLIEKSSFYPMLLDLSGSIFPHLRSLF